MSFFWCLGVPRVGQNHRQVHLDLSPLGDKIGLVDEQKELLAYDIVKGSVPERQ